MACNRTETENDMRHILSTASPGGDHTATRSRRPLRILTGVLALGMVSLSAGVAWADPPAALPAAAPAGDRTFQPARDYDSDGCKPSPAIGPDGTLNPGLKLGETPQKHCDDDAYLAPDKNNGYSRSRCNNGWCAYMYTFYFEKDQSTSGPAALGHRHDWEHIVVWTQGNTAKYVSVSCHDAYKGKGTAETRPAGKVRWEDTHPKVVYHKDGGLTHCFRFANTGDDRIENASGKWHYPSLVGWDNYPPGIRDKLMNADFGEATIGIRDKNNKFLNELTKSKDATGASIPLVL